MPSEKAEGIETVKLCEALARKAEVLLVYPARRNSIEASIYDYYSVVENFKSLKMPVLDLSFISGSKLFFYIEILSFAFISTIYSFFAIGSEDVIFTHDPYLAFILSLFRKNVVFDMHDFPRSHVGHHKKLFKRLLGITTTNRWKKNKLIQDFGVPAEKVMSQPNGVDIDEFSINHNRLQVRKDLNLPNNSVVIEYVGMLRTMGMKKGLDTLFDALKLLPENIVVLLVGGSRADIDYYTILAKDLAIEKRVFFAGWVRHSDIPAYLRVADVLVAPFPKNEHYDHYMCPMKVIEYMASGRPMVVSDLESIREIVDENTAYFFKPEDANALARSISETVGSQDKSNKKAEAAFERSKIFSWNERALKITDFLSAISK